MSSEITNQTMVLVSRLGDFWITPEQAAKLTAYMKAEPSGSFTLEGNEIMIRSVDGILTPDVYQTYNLKRSGGWQCKYKHWHEKNQQCAHGARW